MERSLRYNPIFGRVLIKREIQKKIGSIIIPESQQMRQSKAEGVIVGLGVTAGWTENPATGRVVQTIKIGDKVIFGRHAGAWLDATLGKDGKEQDDGTLFICQDADILMVVEDEQQAKGRAA